MKNDVFQEAARLREWIWHYDGIVKSLRNGCTIELREGAERAGCLTEPEVREIIIEHYEAKIEKLEKEFEDL